MTTTELQPTRRRLAIVQLALGMAVFGSATPVSKIVTDAMPVFVGAGLRVAVGALLLAPVLALRRSALAGMNQADWLRVSAIAFFGMFAFSVLMLLGMRRVSGVMGAVVMSTTPAVTAAGAVLFLGESATWRRVVAVALAVAGVLVLHLAVIGGNGSGPGVTQLALGSALIFGAVCCEATYTLLGRRASRHLDSLVVAALAAVLSLPLFIPFALWEWFGSGFDPTAVTPRVWTALVWYGAGTLALGSWLWYAGLSRTPGTIAAAFMGIMPLSALLLSYILLDETFAWSHAVGFGIVLGGVILISWEHGKSDR